jgi:hypothetical protein
MRAFDHTLSSADKVYAGFVQLSCNWDGNRVRGRIDFKHCR